MIKGTILKELFHSYFISVFVNTFLILLSFNPLPLRQRFIIYKQQLTCFFLTFLNIKRRSHANVKIINRNEWKAGFIRFLSFYQFYEVWFGWVLWHINSCRLFNGKSSLYTYIRGAFNRFPDFFVQAFKIDVDSWKFRMLLLYILWDDWFQVQMNSYSSNWNTPYESLIAQLVNFKNAIWTWGHFRRTICNEILF